jgi:hypothetical protein
MKRATVDELKFQIAVGISVREALVDRGGGGGGPAFRGNTNHGRRPEQFRGFHMVPPWRKFSGRR